MTQNILGIRRLGLFCPYPQKVRKAPANQKNNDIQSGLEHYSAIGSTATLLQAKMQVTSALRKLKQ